MLLDCEPLAKIVYWDCRSRCSEIQPQKVDREKLAHRVGLCRLVYTIIVLMVNAMGYWEGNLLILKRLHKSEQRKMSSWKSDFFVQFRVFYNKEFTRQKKVTNKLPHKSAKMALSYADNCHFKALSLHGKLFVVMCFANSNRV